MGHGGQEVGEALGATPREGQCRPLLRLGSPVLLSGGPSNSGVVVACVTLPAVWTLLDVKLGESGALSPARAPLLRCTLIAGRGRHLAPWAWGDSVFPPVARAARGRQ